MYNNDRNDLNAPQVRPENNSLSSAPPQVWPASEPPNVTFYNPSTSQTPYFCPQPTHSQQTDAWSWSTEKNNNNATIFQPQSNSLNPQADPWQWSVDQSSESNQWVTTQAPLKHLNDQSQQASYEQFHAQPVPEQDYYYGQVPQEQWNYSDQQQLGYQPDINNWSSWNQPNEPTWNPVSLDTTSSENQSVPEPIMSSPPQNIDLIDPVPLPNHLGEKTGHVDSKELEEIPVLPAISDPPLHYNKEIQVDEPNQEVPEPVKPLEIPTSSPVHKSSIVKHEISEIPSSPDPPNEQVLCKNMVDNTQKPLVIQPWEGGPFQPPQVRPSTTEIVQKEVPEESVESVSSIISKLDISKDSEETANMESEPDNLERPPDPNVNKINPHHVALHKEHFAEELDNEAAKTNLWEQPNLPSVLLLPASASNNLSRSGSPASKQAPPSIPVVIPSVESIKNSAILDKTVGNLTPNSQTQSLQNTINNNELNLSETKDLNNRNEPEIGEKPLKLSNLSLGKDRSQSPGHFTSKNYVQHTSSLLDTRRRSKESQDRQTESGRQDPKNYRYREMEDLDNPYHRERYYYNNDKNSRPSSRASEPVRSHYSSRYEDRNQDYEFSGPPRPERLGTPSRVLGSQDDIRNIRPSYDYRGDLRGSNRDLREDFRDYRDHGDSRIPKDNRYPEDYRDFRGQRDNRDPRDRRNVRDPREVRETRDPREIRDPSLRDSQDLRSDRRSNQDYETDSKRGRVREDYPDSRGGFEDDQRQQQPYVKGGEEDYYKMNRNYNKGGGYGYEYYRPPDPYSMYYNYYNFPMNYNYGYYDELYRSNPKYREQVDNYRAYYSQAGYESDRMSSHSRSGRSSVNEDISKDSSRYQKDYDTSSEYSGYQNSLNFDNSQDTHLDSASASHIATPPARLTPSKFSCPHAIAKISPGRIIFSMPLASSISDTSIQIHDLQQMVLLDKNVGELKSFPGPLISGETHKNDVIQFCQQKIAVLQRNIDFHDRDSRILLWELLVLMLRQNGNVSGSDIAELLLKDRHQSKAATLNPSLTRQASTAGSSSSPSDDTTELPTLLTTSGDGHLIANGSTTPSPDEGIVVSQDNRVSGTRSSERNMLTTEQITEKFTEYLLFGHKKDALEWATKHGLWGHALFLASKMDSRSYANIMTRFANSLPLNDPLQTLYQLMSGRQPYAVTRLADEKFGDWRIHLAMILSNLSSQPEVDGRSITTLGDTLAQRGCLSAAHFCYLMSQVEFGKFEQKASKMVLLSSNHTLPFSEFSSNEAIQCTEIYEYAQSLANPAFVLTHLQPYKFLYATRLAEYGLLQESLHYCEALTMLAKKSPASVSSSLLMNISEIAWKLKYHDPHYTQAQGELEDIADPEWLTQLLSLPKDGSFINSNGTKSSEETYANDSYQTSSYSTEQDGGGTWNTSEDPTGQYSQQNYVTQTNTEWNSNQNVYSQPAYFGSYGQAETQESMPNINQSLTDSTEPNQQTSTLSNSYSNESPTKNSSFDYYGSATAQFQAPPLGGRERQDSVGSLGGYGRRDSNFSNSSSTSVLNNANAPSLAKQAQTKNASAIAASKKDQKGKLQVSGSWFGSFLGKLLPRGPNQMILPDDKNPTIVWDAKNSKWVNTFDDDGNTTETAPVAPPKDSELKGPSFASPPMMNNNFGGNSPVGGPPANPPMGVNRFQRPKFKSMRQNYVDVLNMNISSGAPTNNNYEAPPSQPLPPAENMFPNVDSTSQVPNFFIPAPAPSSTYLPNDFVTQGHILLPNNDPAEFSTAPKNMGGEVGQKRAKGGYNLGSRRAYPS